MKIKNDDFIKSNHPAAEGGTPPPLAGNYMVQSKNGNWLESYINYVKNVPMLSEAEENDLIARVKKFKDREAAEKIITAHLRMVVSTAYEMQTYSGFAMQDMIAEGTIGLLKALDKFDPDKGVRFSVYANYWIRAEIYSMIWDNWSSVKIAENPARKKIFFNIGRARRALGITNAVLGRGDMERIGEFLDVPVKEVEFMSTRMVRDSSLNAPARGEDGDQEIQDRLASHDEMIGDVLEKKEFTARGSAILQRHLAALPERDRDIITRRRLLEKPETLEEVAARYSISKERVRQIENRVFEGLKANVLADAENLRIGEKPVVLIENEE
ncbi:MAG: RNA polymerase factor sigma-32 [Rickettsiales bacterium]|jgi:RNA polymerase sigma-32 factor|nr:RNA polymerase factor sigma-32 [Rickettsiales bacterium]